MTEIDKMIAFPLMSYSKSSKTGQLLVRIRQDPHVIINQSAHCELSEYHCPIENVFYDRDMDTAARYSKHDVLLCCSLSYYHNLITFLSHAAAYHSKYEPNIMSTHNFYFVISANRRNNLK